MNSGHEASAMLRNPRRRLWARLDEVWLHPPPKLSSNDEARVGFLDVIEVAVDVDVVSLTSPSAEDC